MSHIEPRRRHPSTALLATLAAAVLGTLLAVAPAAAQEESNFQLELVAGLLFDDEIDENAYGIRAGYRLSERTWVEARLDHIDVGSFEFWLLDASIKYFFDNWGRSRWYVLGGPGTTFRSLGDIDDSGLLLHVGVGTEIDLTDRLFLRPEIVALWREDDFDTLGGDASFAVGWRF